MIEEELMRQFFNRLPVLPEGWIYDFSFERVFDLNSKVWKYNITAKPIQKEV